jgi:hypothetical protein
MNKVLCGERMKVYKKNRVKLNQYKAYKGPITSPPLKASRLTAVASCSGSWFHRRMFEGTKENFMVSVLQN